MNVNTQVTPAPVRGGQRARHDGRLPQRPEPVESGLAEAAGGVQPSTRWAGERVDRGGGHRHDGHCPPPEVLSDVDQRGETGLDQP
jgi:hypothetical protein